MSEMWTRERIGWMADKASSRLPTLRGAGKIPAHVVGWCPALQPTIGEQVSRRAIVSLATVCTPGGHSKPSQVC
jgi:hypothetical protein